MSRNRRPDATALYNDKRVARIEVQSRTDIPTELMRRNEALNPQLRKLGFNPQTTQVVLSPYRKW